MLTEAGTEQVAGLVGLAKVVVTAQERLTVPVNPPDGIALMVEVLLVVAPEASVKVLLDAESANALCVTVTVAELLVAGT